MEGRRWGLRLLGAFVMLLAGSVPVHAQLGALVSPGVLTKPHADLEGVSKCQQCHERGQQVSAVKCLQCHKPVAERMARKVGVHRAVTTDCVQCHVEHTGLEGELRPFDQAGFKHATETAFALDGKHAPLATKCAACHKSRTFLDAKTTCVSCHRDVHAPSLGADCAQCHSTRNDFKMARETFDHASTRFSLTGAHQTATCVSCHPGSSFAGARFASCANCHESPHAPRTVSGTCASCHTTARWATTRFDHAATKFPLLGKHTSATCASCHKDSATKVKPASGTCATCHADVHKGEFRQDCQACHDERSFTGGTFDHTRGTTFPLTDGHAKVLCQRCHTGITRGGPVARASVDFRGAKGDCATCHTDPHRAELGARCEACHTAKSFKVGTFAHARTPEFFAGQHAPVACEKCHVPALTVTAANTPAKVALAGSRFTTTATACASCHRDVHLGQVSQECQTCHSVEGLKFIPDRFAHSSSTFRLTGAHERTACEKCHAREAAAFPAGPGTAVRLTGLSTTCVSCHADVHLGQVSRSCETCHSTTAFGVKSYTHKNARRDFFVGPHVSAPCAECHKSVTERFPSGRGTAVKFAVSTTCVACHVDVHRGSMGTSCRDCHRLQASDRRQDPAPTLQVAAISHVRRLP